MFHLLKLHFIWKLDQFGRIRAISNFVSFMYNCAISVHKYVDILTGAITVITDCRYEKFPKTL